MGQQSTSHPLRLDTFNSGRDTRGRYMCVVALCARVSLTIYLILLSSSLSLYLLLLLHSVLSSPLCPLFSTLSSLLHSVLSSPLCPLFSTTFLSSSLCPLLFLLSLSPFTSSLPSFLSLSLLGSPSRKATPLNKNEGVYVRDVQTGQVYNNTYRCV